MSSPVEFNYDGFASDDADYLRVSAEFINARTALVYDLIIQAGRRLIEVQEFFNRTAPRKGLFAKWVRHTLSINEDTAYNYINAAINAGNLDPDTAQNITQRALYMLARTATEPEVRQIAFERASAGVPVDDKEVLILAGHPDVRNRYIDGDLSKVQAAGLVRLVKESEADPNAVAQVLAWQVKEPEVAAYLLEASTQTDKRSAWQDVVSDGGVLNGIEWSVPVADATIHDLARWKEDRQTMHKIHAAAKKPAMQHYELKGVIRRVGQTVVIEVQGGQTLPLEVLGQRAFLDVRVRLPEHQESTA